MIPKQAIKDSDTCSKCGETRGAIRKHKMICGSTDPQTGELDQEYGRHRYQYDS